MTQEEYNQYITLDLSQRQQYQEFRRQNPGWSHNQLMAKIQLKKTLSPSEVLTEGEGYNHLTEEERDQYHLFKKYHPDWPHEKILLQVQSSSQLQQYNSGIHDAIKYGGQDVVLTTEVAEKIAKQTQSWFKKYAPIIAKALETYFSRLLSSLGNLIKEGVSYAWETTKTFFSDLWDDFCDLF